MEDGPPVFPAGFTCPLVLWIQPADSTFRIQDSHLLRLAFPSHSAKICQCVMLSKPREYFYSRFAVWPLPRSLATTYGISVDFFSSPYLDVSVQAVPHIRLFYSPYVDCSSHSRVSPFGNPRVEACFRLTVAYRRSLRPSSAPGAKAFPLRSL